MMSLGLSGTDNNCNSGSRRVNMKIWSGVSSFNRNLSRHQVSCLLALATDIELRVFKKKEKKNKEEKRGF